MKAIYLSMTLCLTITSAFATLTECTVGTKVRPVGEDIIISNQTSIRYDQSQERHFVTKCPKDLTLTVQEYGKTSWMVFINAGSKKEAGLEKVCEYKSLGASSQFLSCR